MNIKKILKGGIVLAVSALTMTTSISHAETIGNLSPADIGNNMALRDLNGQLKMLVLPDYIVDNKNTEFKQDDNFYYYIGNYEYNKDYNILTVLVRAKKTIPKFNFVLTLDNGINVGEDIINYNWYSGDGLGEKQKSSVFYNGRIAYGYSENFCGDSQFSLVYKKGETPKYTFSTDIDVNSPEFQKLREEDDKHNGKDDINSKDVFTKGQLKNSTVDESKELKKLVKKHKDTDLLTLKAQASKVGSTYTSKVGKLSKKKISKVSDIKPSKSETAKNNDYKQNIKQANVTQQEKKYPHIIPIAIGLSVVILLVVVTLSIRYIKK